MKNKKRKIVISCIIIVLIIIAVWWFFSKNELYIREEKIDNEEIEHIALVYRKENYLDDYVYIIKEDGSVYYEDFEKNGDKYTELEGDFEAIVLEVYENEDNIKYYVEPFSANFKECLYNVNYNVALFKKTGVLFDAGKEPYCALIRIGDEYKLVELQQCGNNGKIPWSSDYKEVCEFIDEQRAIILELRQKDER